VIPYGIIALIAVKALMSARSNPTPEHPNLRQASNDRAVAMIMWAFIAPMIVLLPLLSWWLILVSLLLFLLLYFPTFVATRFAIPRGKPELARLLGKAAFWHWRDDRPGGAIAFALLALANRKNADVEKLSDEYAQLLLKAKVGAGGVLLSSALLAHRRGDRERARVLLETGALLSPKLGSTIGLRWMREHAVTQLVADGELLRAARIDLDTTPRGALLVRIARELSPGWDGIDESGRPQWRRDLPRMQLARRMDRSVRRRMIARERSKLTNVGPYARLFRALDVRTGAGRPRLLVPELASATQRAVLALALAQKQGVADDASLAHLGEILDEAHDEASDEVQRWLIEAAREVTKDVPRALRFRSESFVLHEAFDHGESALDQLFQLCERLANADDGVLPLSAELESWATLRILYERALADSGDVLDSLPFSAVRDVVWNRGATNFNGGHRELGVMMFAFLLEEGLKRDDDSVIDAMIKNLRL